MGFESSSARPGIGKLVRTHPAPAGSRSEPRRAPVFLSDTLALLLSGLLLLSSTASAVWDNAVEDISRDEREPVGFRGFTARLENDVFARADRNYTSGVASMLASGDMSGPVETVLLPVPMGLHAAIIKLANPGFWSGAGACPRHATWC